MADDKKVTLTITSKFDKKGTDEGKKALKETEKQAEKTNETLAKGASNAKGKIVELAAGVDLAKNAFGALQSVGAWIMDCISAANANTRSVNMLAAAYQNVVFTAAGALETAKQFASEMQKLTGLSDETFLDAQRQLANYKVVGTEAQEAIRAAYALSVNKGQSFESALQLITRAAVGNTAALSKLGIVIGDDVKEGDKFAATVAKINEQFGASAQAALGDSVTKTNALKESWGDLKEEIGKGLNDGLVPIVDFLTSSVEFLIKLFKAGGNYCDWGLGIIQTGISGIKTAILGLAELALKSINQIVSVGAKLYLVPKGVAEAVQSADDWLKQATQDAASQTATLNRMRRSITDIWPEEKKITDEQKKQIDLNAEQINKKRQLGLAEKENAKAATKSTEQATKEATQLAQFKQNLSISTANDLSRKELEISKAKNAEELSALREKYNEEYNLALTQLENKKKFLEEGTLAYQEALEEEAALRDEKKQLDEKLKEEEQQKETDKLGLSKLINSEKAKNTQSTINTITAGLKQGSKEQMAVEKASASASALMKTYEMANSAYSALAGIPVVGPALGAAAAAAAMAYGLNNVSSIAGIKLANGGLVKAVTGGVNAVIGEGGSDEAVLPLDNARAMRRIGGAIADESGGLGGGAVINVNINASGGLVPFLDELTEATQNGVTEALRYANVAVKAGNAQGGLSV